MKKDENPAQVFIKLLMNSMYGKTITKPIEPYTIIAYSQHDSERYVSLNYNYIDSVSEVNGRYYIKEVKSVMSHYNYVHAGVEILSMSRRIMHKVFSCYSDCGVKLYYRDTDSIHLTYDDVDKVVERYNDKYGQALVGKNLGQFHVDLPDIEKNCGEVYGIESYVLGKHTYLDMLESTNEEGHIIKAYQIRMRSIPTACIKYYAQQKKITVFGYLQEVI